MTSQIGRKVPLPEVRDAGVASCLPHGRYVTFQLAEMAVTGDLFCKILRLIDELQPPPTAA